MKLSSLSNKFCQDCILIIEHYHEEKIVWQLNLWRLVWLLKYNLDKIFKVEKDLTYESKKAPTLKWYIEEIKQII